MSDTLLRDEIDTLYQLTERLKNVSRPMDQLEALSDYAKIRGACHTLLYYIEQGRDRIFAHVAAEWASNPDRRIGIGSQLDTGGTLLKERLNEGEIILLDDTYPQLPGVMKDIFQRTNTNSAALLPLMNNDRAIGVICYLWYGLHDFTEREKRIFSAILRLAAPVIDSVRLLEQANRRTVELEVANREMDILYSMIHQLTSARTPAEQLEAVSEYARINGASCGTLFYVHQTPEGDGYYAEVAAEWGTNSRQLVGVGTRMNTFHSKFGQYCMREEVALVENTYNHPETDETDLQIFGAHDIYSIVQLALVSNEYVGAVSFLWSRPQHFTQRDRRIYTALRYQLAPVMASVRMHEETEQRATELERANRELDTLYNISSRLASANTYYDLLHAISDYGSGQKVTYAAFINLTKTRPEDNWQIMAEWRTPEGRASAEAEQMTREFYDTLYDELKNVGTLLFLTSSEEEGRFTVSNSYYRPGEPEEPGVVLMKKYDVKTMVMMPLRRHGTISDLVVLEWDVIYPFTEELARIYRIFVQQVTPVLESIRLLEESSVRASRAEMMVKINTALSKARDENEIMEAVAIYATRRGIEGMVLTYFDTTTETLRVARKNEVAALTVWLNGKAATYNPEEHQLYEMDDADWFNLWQDNPEELRFIDNIETDPSVPEKFRDAVLQNARTRAMVAMPLYNAGRRIAFMTIAWITPQTFTDEDRYIFNAINQSLAAVVASRRAYIAQEEARKENELLYQMGEAINAARTYQEIVEALAPIDPQADAITMEIWENFDFETASYFEVVGVLNKSGLPLPEVGQCFQTELFAVSAYLAGEAIWTIEDTHADERMDEITRASWDAMDTRALLSTTFHFEGHWAGGVAFHSKLPRTYSHRDKRLAAGIGELVTSAVDRIRLQMETEAARKETELLYQIGEAINAARTFEEILAAVAPVDPKADAIIMDIWENYTSEDAGYFELVAKQGRLASVLPELRERLDANMFPTVNIIEKDAELMWYIEDTHTDPRVDDISRTNWDLMQTRATLSLKARVENRDMGCIAFHSENPRKYTERDKRLASGVSELVSTAVDRIRLQMETEAARKETELLYQIGEAVNAARTYQEILEAVALIEPDAPAITMELWDNFDSRTANYFELVAARYQPDMNIPPLGSRFPSGMFLTSDGVQSTVEDPVWYIEDCQNDPRIDEVGRQNWANFDTYALIGSNARIGGRHMGTVMFHSKTPRIYTESEKRIVAGVGELLSTAIDRIRLQNESEYSRKRAETLARINAGLSQATNEDEILAAVAPLAEEYGVAFASLNYAITDEKGAVIGVDMVAVRSPEIGIMNPGDMPIRTFKMEDFPLLRHAYENPYDCLCLEGIRNDEHSGDIFEASALGWPSSVLIPLHTGDGWQGILMFVWSEPQEISDDMRSIFRDIRPAASSVVTSRRAYVAQRQRAHELETVAKVSAAVTSILNVDNLVKTVASLARTSFTDYRLFVYLLDESGRQLNRMMTDDESEIQRSVNAPGAMVDMDTPRSLIAHVAKTRQGVIVNDITHSNKFILASMLPNARSEMAVPMINADKLIGVIDVQSTVMNRFTQSDILMMSTLADMIAVAVQNAYLYERAQKFAALEERNRLARELHDSVSQALYGIALGARTARTLLDKNPTMLTEPLDYILSLSEAGLTEMRSLIFELRPETLENEGLIVALNKQAASLQTRHNIKVETNLCAEPVVSLDMKETLYRIAREALHNTVKHAKASRVQLRMEMTETCIVLCVSDNGIGFNTSGEFHGHLGLKSMRERTAHLRGTVDIQSTVGEGTQITVKLPLG